jgi:5'-3' exonuclease
LDDYKYESYLYQRERVKDYLEEVFVRQCVVEQNEADDLIAHYTHIAKDENMIIFSGDKDLTQLITDNVTLYSPVSKTYSKKGDLIHFKNIDIPHNNVYVYKVLIGDTSDNIYGITNFGEKKLKTFFPNFDKRDYTLDEVLNEAKLLFGQNKSKTLSNLISGISKSGLVGDEFFEKTGKIIDLRNPLITDEGKNMVYEIYNERLDPTDRSYKNLLKLMRDDGFFKFLPKKDDAWVDFVKPFMKLSRKEKKF